MNRQFKKNTDTKAKIHFTICKTITSTCLTTTLKGSISINYMALNSLYCVSLGIINLKMVQFM